MPFSRSLLVFLTTIVLVPLPAIASKLHRADQAPGEALQIEMGKEAFVPCAGCHGANGEGVVGLAPRLNSANYLAAISNDFLATAIKQGRPGSNMVPWDAGLGEETVNNLVAYIRSWQSTKGAKLDESPLKGDVEAGGYLFVDVCARCHGIRGAGYSAGVDGLGIGRRAYLDSASDGMLRYLIVRGKDSTPMEAFSNGSPVVIDDLSSEQIDGLIMWLRANAW